MSLVRRLVATTLMLALVSTGLLAQTSADADQTAKVHAKLEKIFDAGARAKLQLKDGRKVQGSIAELDAESFVLATAGRSQAYSYADVKKVGRFGPSPNSRKWVALGFLGGLFGFIFWAAATQTR